MEFKHISVLLEESVDMLNIKPDGVYVDGTLGGGGHSEFILKRLGENGRLVGIDRDMTAIKAAGKRLENYKERLLIAHDNYRNIKQVLKNFGIEYIDGAILDLGVSSPQLDDGERGFSYNQDARLDMMMK